MEIGLNIHGFPMHCNLSEMEDDIIQMRNEINAQEIWVDTIVLPADK